MADKPDDLDAVRVLVDTLAKFDADAQERIIRWTREKLGLSAAPATPPAGTHNSPPPGPGAGSRHPTTNSDIKSFVEAKKPSSNNEFAAVVAYYYLFEATEAARKQVISSTDLQDACRLAGRTRLPDPGQTLFNAHTAGLLDKSGDRGSYAISTVGENLVAMTLPASHPNAKFSNKTKTTKPKTTKANKKKKK